MSEAQRLVRPPRRQCRLRLAGALPSRSRHCADAEHRRGHPSLRSASPSEQIRAAAVEFAADWRARPRSSRPRSSACTPTSRPHRRNRQPPVRRPEHRRAGRGGWSWYLRPPPCLPTSARSGEEPHRMRSSRKGAVTGESVRPGQQPRPVRGPGVAVPGLPHPRVRDLARPARPPAGAGALVRDLPPAARHGSRADRSGLSQPRLAGPGRHRPGSSWRSWPRCGWAGRLCSPGW